MSTTRWIIETDCPHGYSADGRHWVEADLHHDGLDADGRSVFRAEGGWCSGSRIVVDPDNLPPEVVWAMFSAIAEELSTEPDNPEVQPSLLRTCERGLQAAMGAFLSDPEPGDQT